MMVRSRCTKKQTGKLLNTFEGMIELISSIAITSDNTKVVTAGSGDGDDIVEVWDLASGQLLNTLEGNIGIVYLVAVTLDNTKVVSGSDRGPIRVWDLASGQLLNTLEGHIGTVSSLALAPDNIRVAAGGVDDKTLMLWDIRSSQLRSNTSDLNAERYRFKSIVVTFDNTRIITGSDNKVMIWDIQTGKLLNTLHGHIKDVTSVAVTPDNLKIITGSNDGTVKIWDMHTGKLLSTLKGHTAGVKFVEFVAVTPDNTKVVSMSKSHRFDDDLLEQPDNTIWVWDMQTGKLLNTIDDYMLTVVVTPDSTRIVTATRRGAPVKIYDLQRGKLLNTLKSQTHIHTVIVTSDNAKVISTSTDGRTLVRDLNSGQLLYTIDAITDSVLISPDNTKIFTGYNFMDISGYDYRAVKRWDIQTGKLLNTIYDAGEVVAVTPDNTKIITMFDDKTVKIWDIQTSKLLNTIDEEIDFTTITPDGTKIITMFDDKTVKIWDIQTGKLLNSLYNEVPIEGWKKINRSNIFSCKLDFPVTAIDFSTDNKYMVIGDNNGNMYLLEKI